MIFCFSLNALVTVQPAEPLRVVSAHGWPEILAFYRISDLGMLKFVQEL